MQKFTLKNSLPVLFAPSKGTDTVTVMILVGVGSRYEYKKLNGASHFIEHLLFKGTKRRPTTQDITRELDSIGADFNAFTDKHVTGYYVKVSKTHLKLALDILSDMLFNSVFDKTELDRERGVVIEEINMYRDNPMRHVEDIVEDEMYKGNTLGRNIAGTPKTMKEMPRDEILEYYKKHYSASNMVVVVSGNINKKAKVWVENKFSVVRKGKSDKEFEEFKITKPKKSPRICVEYKKTEQIQLALGFYTYGIDSKKNHIVSLLSVILGGNMSSRLFIEVRERLGLAYFVRAYSHQYDDIGTFMIRAGLDKKRLPLAVKTILKEVKSIIKKGVTKQELVDAKTYIQGQFSIQLEDTYQRASWYATQALFKDDVKTPAAYLKKIDGVTLEEIQDVAKEILDLDQMTVAVIGPYKSKEEFIRKAKI